MASRVGSWALALALCADVLLGPRTARAQLAPVPALSGPLVDLAAVATGPLLGQLQAELLAVRQDTGVQLVVLTLPTLAGEEAAPYAHRVMEAWRLGAKGSDLGLLLVVVSADRTTRLEVGYGLEGVLPDALAKQILADVLAPKNPSEALGARHLLGTVQVLHRLLQQARDRGELPQVTPDAAMAPQAAAVPLWALAVGVVLVLLLARYLISFMPKEGRPAASGSLGDPYRGRLAGRGGPGGGAFWHMLVQLLLSLLSGGGRGGPPAGGGYSGGGGRSGGGGASDKY